MMNFGNAVSSHSGLTAFEFLVYWKKEGNCLAGSGCKKEEFHIGLHSAAFVTIS